MSEDDTPQDDLAARAGWLYYVGGMRQDQIAEELGISRQRAQISSLLRSSTSVPQKVSVAGPSA